MNPTVPPQSPSGSKKILLVEDEDFIRELYVRQLAKAGFNIKSAPDGQAGLSLLKTEPFDLLLLDIMLPGMNGLQLLREFKTQNPSSSMMTILLTNLGQEAVIKEGFELGATAYLIKASYTPDQVVTEVKNVLSGGQSTPPTPQPGAPPTAGTPPTSSPPPTGTPPSTPPASQPPTGVPPTGTPPIPTAPVTPAQPQSTPIPAQVDPNKSD